MSAREQLLNSAPRDLSGIDTVELPVTNSLGLLTDEPIARIRCWADCGHDEFQSEAVLFVPKMISLLEGEAGDGFYYTHLMVNVRGLGFAEHPTWKYQVTACVNHDMEYSHTFYSFYAQHHILIPLGDLRKETNVVSIVARHISAESDGSVPQFAVRAFACSRPRTLDRLETGAIWLFSTARAGSTWLQSDILCANERARPVDESGVGRMFAPLRWEPEALYGLASKRTHFESGFEFETGAIKRAAGTVPPFERAFSNLDVEDQILHRYNVDLYLRLLREVALEHVMHIWGTRGYSRLVLKCPNDAHAADFIMRAFPKSHMIFLLRDGRDVMRSRFSAFSSNILSETRDPELRKYAIAYYSHFWNFQVDIIQSAYDRHDPAKRLFVKYEDLRSSPEKVIAHVLHGIDMQASDEDITSLAESSRLENFANRGPDKPRQNGIVGGYRHFFTDEEIALMNEIMGSNLSRYGYALT